ncbi:hypothetical protein KC19_2G123900 [Ceratodon purpureus]|uniref:3-oxo-5-alpha-steroid 4-dehydrogenase C-terminal domain-containing protein n=1 Tax=Ceratodon purpureus TaxID=3225 RepID=A0A8T0IT28_CERPU|nr:hypothetical protein KC19_2G123900 [Ceratodon purpureus]
MEFGTVVVLGLRVLWSLAVGGALIGLLPLGAVSEFVRDLSRRGKLKLASSANNPPRFTVPQRWFAHFYVLGSLVNTLLLVVTFLFAYSCTFPLQSEESQVSAVVAQLGGAGTSDSNGGVGNVGHLAKYRGRAWGSFVLLVMLGLQLLRRLLETNHISQYSPLARMSIFGYLVGLGFYPAASLTFFSQHFQDQDYLSLICKFVVQRLGSAWVLHTGPPLLNSRIELKEYVKSVRGLEAFQLVGMAVFLLGWIQQYRLHSILASLRAKKVRTGIEAVLKPYSTDKKKVDRYEIPQGSWFEWVSCAHYLAEIVLYAGIVIASGGNNLNIWLFYSWVVLNLTLAASETHKWYKSKFEDYPPFRRAMFPFIY